ncbi:tRNA 2-thiouridine(34) synthase MnmA [Candidatus Saccharibacteria bacterium]|nr:tRNA 2-thiouridine(34) synthase MnmA [Candidatus Saccharibacteria bacterium]MBR3233560.1 tRNA 2-thiouridine(34) synthase MnmA [Candidatus Saccharibacteria bacterium]
MPKNQQKTVFLGMSGGVDSSLSAVLLKEQGYNVVGVYMKNWSRDLPGMKCPWAEDLADAKRVAVKLGIDFRVFDFETEYKQKVVDYMLAEFKKGNTPNPDIMCNQEIKFKLFYDVAMEQGADLIATGHYARVGRESEREITLSSRPTLLMAKDANKDQTYFLYRISEEALNRTLFPVGDMLKTEVKKLAAEKGLDNAYKKESMGVCFVGEVGMKDFLKEYIDIQPGEIIDVETGKVLGMHEGAIFYTVGQRHGLNVGGGLPYYVVKKDIEKNLVYVSANLNHQELWTKKLELKDVILRDLMVMQGEQNTEIQVRLRHRAPLIPAQLEIEHNKNNAIVSFEKPIKTPASGQSVVFYDSEVCLGGGIIR